jgi:hypothetical protein
VQNARRARALFEDLLAGSAREVDGRLIYRWQDSPLRIAVSLDPAREEGPLALEVATPRRLALARDAEAALGVRIVQVQEERG